MKSKLKTLPAGAKKLVNDLLSPSGFQLVRQAPPDNRKEVTVKIGNYPVLIQGNNRLWREYTKNPEYTGQLKRIAALVFQAYPDAMAIDVGANIGDTAALIRTAANVPILCVEGDANVIPLLQKNTQQLGNVSIKQHFLGEKDGQITVITDKEGWDATLIPSDSAAGTKIEIITLDQMVRNAGLKKACKLLKVDVEGFDLRVLRGSAQTLKADRPVVLFELNHQNLENIGEQAQSIFPFLAALDYSQLAVFDGQGNFILSSTTGDRELLDDLYQYARGLEYLYYYDICAFSKTDDALAREVVRHERAFRSQCLKKPSGTAI